MLRIVDSVIFMLIAVATLFAADVRGRFVRIESGASKENLHFSEVLVYRDGTNAAFMRPVTASSTMGDFKPEKAVDGRSAYTWGKDPSFWSSSGKGNDWWEVDLGDSGQIEKILVQNRFDCCQTRLAGAHIRVLAADRSETFQAVLSGDMLNEFVFIDREERMANTKPLAERMQDIAPRFTKIIDDPAQVMPVGSGDLSAMLRYTDALEIHLSKADLYAVEKKPYHKSPTIHSPGHVRLSFGIPNSAVTGFEERMDYAHGSVITTVTTAGGMVSAEVFGIMGKNTIIAVIDDTRAEGTVSAEFSAWRPDMKITAENGIVIAREVHRYDESGREPNASAVSASDRMFNLGIASACSFADENGLLTATDEGDTSRRRILPVRKGKRSYFILSAAVTYDGNPEAEAQRMLQGVAAEDKAAVIAENAAWWKRYWGAAHIDLYGKDGEQCMRMWYATMHSYACTAGPSHAPVKFNGGPGLVQRDERSWGWGYWYQNTRELLWPMYAANRIEYAKAYLDFYDRQYMDLKAQTAKQGKIGIRMWEMALPLKPGTPVFPKTVSTFESAALDAAIANRTMEDCKSGYNARSICQAAELVQLMFDHVAYTGDRDYLKVTVAPWLKEAVLFFLSWLKLEDDGYYHMTPSDAIEMWWKVKDPMTDLCAVRYLLWQAAAHGESFGYEPSLLAVIRERADKLAPLPLGIWKRRKVNKEELPPGSPSYYTEILDTIERTDKYYAPAGDVYEDRIVHNQENPELYIVYPLTLVDASSPSADRDRAVNTFRARKHPNSAGWSQCPVQAVRLRLPDAIDVVMDHARRHQRYPYGGWNSPATLLAGSSLGVTDTPYFDAAGVNATALQEALLQCHERITPERTDPVGCGPISVIPAVRAEWMGNFTLRARGGFLVNAVFSKGRRVQRIAISAERENTLRLVNPFSECRVIKAGKEIRSTKEPLVTLAAVAGDIFEFTGR